MPEIHFVIDKETGDMTMTFTGFKGHGHAKLHKAISDDMRELLGIEEIASEVRDTPEAHERETVQQSTRLNLRG